MKTNHFTGIGIEGDGSLIASLNDGKVRNDRLIRDRKESRQLFCQLKDTPVFIGNLLRPMLWRGGHNHRPAHRARWSDEPNRTGGLKNVALRGNDFPLFVRRKGSP